MEPWRLILEQCRLSLEPWRPALEFGGSLWSLETHFGWRLIQELLGHGAKELIIENEVLPINHGAHPKIMEAHTGVIQAQSKTREADVERWKVIVEF
jgi:hypothetical protein